MNHNYKLVINIPNKLSVMLARYNLENVSGLEFNAECTQLYSIISVTNN